MKKATYIIGLSVGFAGLIAQIVLAVNGCYPSIINIIKAFLPM